MEEQQKEKKKTMVLSDEEWGRRYKEMLQRRQEARDKLIQQQHELIKQETTPYYLLNNTTTRHHTATTSSSSSMGESIFEKCYREAKEKRELKAKQEEEKRREYEEQLTEEEARFKGKGRVYEPGREKAWQEWRRAVDERLEEMRQTQQEEKAAMQVKELTLVPRIPPRSQQLAARRIKEMYGDGVAGDLPDVFTRLHQQLTQTRSSAATTDETMMMTMSGCGGVPVIGEKAHKYVPKGSRDFGERLYQDASKRVANQNKQQKLKWITGSRLPLPPQLRLSSINTNTL